jgi:hypothetical protein
MTSEITTAPVLRVDDLLADARSKAGLTEFGDDWFLEPLGVLVHSLNTEARLSELGLALTRRRLTALLVDRLRLRALRREHATSRSTWPPRSAGCPAPGRRCCTGCSPPPPS